MSQEWFGSPPVWWLQAPLGHFFDERREVVSDREFRALSVSKAGVTPQLENVATTSNNDARKLVRAGDIAINSRSDRKGSSGLSTLTGSVSVITTVLKPRRIDGRFAHHLIRSEAFQEQFYRFGSGIVADLWSTRWSAMKQIPLAVPPMPEQLAIADYLDRETAEIDAFIADQEELIALLTERRAATIARAVTKGLDSTLSMKMTGVEWLGAVPASWRVSRLSRFFSVTLGKMLDAKQQTEAQFPYVRAGNINDGGLDLDDLYTMTYSPAERARFDLRAGDLLVVEGGAIGVNTYLDSDLPGIYFQKTINRVRSRSDDDPRFLGYQLDVARLSGSLDILANKSTIAHFTAEKLERLPVAIPSASEQQAIVKHLDFETAEIDAAITDAREAIALSKERRAALISAAVTGQIDVTRGAAA